jgi:WD40 repeat protein
MNTILNRALFSFLAALACWSNLAPATAQGYSAQAAVDLPISAQGYPRLAFDPSGTRLAASLRLTGEKGKVVFLNVPDLSVIREVRTDAEPYALSFSRQGDYFGLSLARAKESDDLRFVVLSTTQWNALYAERGLRYAISSLVFDPVGDFLYVGSTDRNELYRFVVGTWQRERIPPLEGIEFGSQCMTLSPDGKYGAMGTEAAKLLAWPMDDSAKAVTLGTQQFKGRITAVAFNKDSSLLAAGDSSGSVMVFYLTRDGLWAWKTLFNLPGGGVTGVQFFKDLSLVTGSTDGTVARWNLEDTAQPVESMNAGPKNAEAIAVDPNGRWLAVGGEKIQIFPLGSPEPVPPTEMPSAPWTIVGSGQVELNESVGKVPASGAAQGEGSAASVSPPAPKSEDLGNFLIWIALGKGDGAAQEWIQPWAGALDEGRFTPLQLVLPFETLNSGVMKTNLGNLGKLLTPKDFSVFYTSAVLSPTKEAGDFPLSVGPNDGETFLLSEWLKGLQASASIAPTVWFLDLRIDLKMEDKTAASILARIVEKIVKNPDGSQRAPIGVGLVTLSREGSYPEVAGNLAAGLAGKADSNGDGQVHDRELVLYLQDRCRTALRVQALGNAQNIIPVVPPFRLQAN